MTEELICQKFTYAEINVYKNYTNIEHGPKLSKGWDNKRKNINEIWDFATSTGSPSNTQYIRLYIPYAKRATKFFHYTDEHTDKDKTAKVQGIGRTIYTQDEDIIKRAYNNPFMSVRMVTKEKTIKRVGDKIIIKNYTRYRYRNVNNRYFGKNTNSNSLSINLKTGNFICVEYHNHRGLTRKKFRTNSFEMINNDIRALYTVNMDDGNILWGAYSKEMNTYQFINTLNKTLNINLPNVDLPHNRKLSEDFTRITIQQILDKFVELKQIKVPNNNFIKYLTAFYPTEKYFKKNDRKLIASVLDYFGIKSKFTIKLLHTNTSIDFPDFVCLCKLFGDNYLDYISNINLNNITCDYTDPIWLHSQKIQTIVARDEIGDLNLTHQEKQNLVKIINDPRFNQKRVTGLFRDHFVMLKKLKHFLPNIKMNAKTSEEFSTEHATFSTLLSNIRKGYYTQLIYHEKMLKILESPIKYTYNDINYIFIPVVLKTEMEYKEEGSFVHHCVGGYSDKTNSVIISLRNKNDNDRVTSEFNVIDGRCIQSRYYYNAAPPECFTDALKEIRSKVISLTKGENILKSIELKKIPFDFNEMNENSPIVNVDDGDDFGLDLF